MKLETGPLLMAILELVIFRILNFRVANLSEFSTYFSLRFSKVHEQAGQTVRR
jgi:hypothetical protein